MKSINEIIRENPFNPCHPRAKNRTRINTDATDDRGFIIFIGLKSNENARRIQSDTAKPGTTR